MGACTAVRCSNTRSKGFRLFRFPRDPNRRKIWLQNCRRDKWKPTNHSELCEIHFEEGQFEQHRLDGLKKLKPNAVPTLYFDKPNPPHLLEPLRTSLYKEDLEKARAEIKRLKDENYRMKIEKKLVQPEFKHLKRELLKGGRKKTKDKEVKKNSASIEEETVTITSKKKQLKKGAKSTSAAPRKTPLISVVTSPTNPTNSVASVTVETSYLTGALVGAGVAHSAEVLDMPVDPNEPTYCLCNQVSYGKMIGCDNPDCPIEWFHFACVKLIMKPKGKWFCPKCTTDRKKK